MILKYDVNIQKINYEHGFLIKKNHIHDICIFLVCTIRNFGAIYL